MVTFKDLSLVQIKPIVAGEASMFARENQQMCDKVRYVSFTAAPRNTNYWNTCITLVGKEMFDYCLAHCAGGADSRLDVHQQAWACVDLHNSATLLSKRT